MADGICGLAESFIFSHGRILGGREARLGEVPWYLLSKEPVRAGASLISDRWAITAASAVDGHEDRDLILYGGIVDGSTAGLRMLRSEKIVMHPNYENHQNGHERTNYDNDIALIKLSTRVKLGPNIVPVCLPEKTEEPVMQGMMGTIAGFGAWERSRRSRKLRHAAVQEYSRQKCEDTPYNQEANKPMNFTQNMFCAGLEGVDSCQGDSGGPLVQPMVSARKTGRPYRLKGIISWGPVCGRKTYYTKVQNYLNWIKETIDSDDKVGRL
ncbi:calcium-dependent serine proteinase-like [Denticeps clupeoides]|uniref:calcium-dependent serine proteinase-like n=1 Tax=Denticeps clupeoides TaxID=299321 RepID=UPI0010A3DC2C|nr:calcium-dependent serine proteinase-like [Denticeps clupeoides]